MTERPTMSYLIRLENAITALHIYLDSDDAPPREREAAHACLGCLLAHIAAVRAKLTELL